MRLAALPNATTRGGAAEDGDTPPATSRAFRIFELAVHGSWTSMGVSKGHQEKKFAGANSFAAGHRGGFERDAVWVFVVMWESFWSASTPAWPP